MEYAGSGTPPAHKKQRQSLRLSHKTEKSRQMITHQIGGGKVGWWEGGGGGGVGRGQKAWQKVLFVGRKEK